MGAAYVSYGPLAAKLPAEIESSGQFLAVRVRTLRACPLSFEFLAAFIVCVLASP